MESWRNRKTLILSRTDIMGLLTPAEYNACVEQAYRMHGEKRYYMDPKGHIVLDKFPGEWEAMPSYIEEPEAAACKWVSIRERNREKYDLPTVFSILIYTHPETGFPLAICDGSYHTVMRTGAAGAVSAKWMARQNSKRLAIVGAGHMAEGARHLQRSLQVGRGAGMEPHPGDARALHADAAAEVPAPEDQSFDRPRASGARRRRRCDGHPGARTDRDG
jgi:ornithine cyclodeaminase/alanine dehydrogenase-like protein (mu-crystallin family)